MDLDRRAFSFWRPGCGWVVEQGRFRILLAASADDVRMEKDTIWPDCAVTNVVETATGRRDR
jgi:hypothetical protein